MMGGGNQQMAELREELQALEQQQEALQEEQEDLQTEKGKVGDAIEALGTLDTGSTVQVPLGGDAYVRAEVQDINEIIVSLGGGYAVEQPDDKAVETLESKQDSIDDRIDEINEQLSELQSEQQQLEQQAQQMQQQQMQQQMQMQQQDEE